jgi:hypothetical protein
MRAIPLAGQSKRPENLFVVAGHSAAMGVAYMTPVVTGGKEGDP